MTRKGPARRHWTFTFVFWVLAFATLAAGLHAALGWVLPAFGYPDADALWQWIDAHAPFSALFVRLIVFGSIHALAILVIRRRVGEKIGPLLRVFRRTAAAVTAWAQGSTGRTRAINAALAVLCLTVFIPFVLQPTIVPLEFGVRAWAERAANLTDGTASVAVIESVFGAYHRGVDAPVVGPRVADDASTRALVDRWDPLLHEVVGGDRQGFARLKAVMRVESGGRQFAVSPTGCAGLMQFCVGTARGAPFRDVFGEGRVFACRPGVIDRATRHALESGDPARVRAAATTFACAVADARFDPKKSLRAGWMYLERLDATLGGNLDLMYIGYNSGPSVAQTLYRRLGANATPTEIARHLPAALDRAYGRNAAARARSLSHTTLPQLRAALKTYE